MTRVPFLKLFLLGTLLLVAAHQGQGQSGNVLTNPSFESGTTGWTFFTNGAGTFASVTPGFAGTKTGRVSITTAGTNVQLAQVNFALDPNTDYRLTFAAYSNTGHDLSVSVLQDVSPYTNYGLSSSVASLTTGWRTFTMNFRTTGFSVPVSDARLRFWLAPYDAAGDIYYIDNVILQKVGTAPVITTGPTGVTLLAGDSATFSVVATGSDTLRYQWQRNAVDIPGATAVSYTTPPTVLADNGAAYRCVVTNAFGTATSAGATLSVLDPTAPPTITQQPSDQIVMSGQTATFTVTAVGFPPLSYQWQKNSVDIPSANSPGYTTPLVTLADSGSIFRCIVTNPNGPTPSLAALLRVDSLRGNPPVVTIQPLNQSVQAGQTATFAVAATGTAPLSYQWQKNAVNISGAGSAGYTTPATVLGDNGATYRCVVTNSFGTATSNSATLTVTVPPPVGLSSPQPGELYKEFSRTMGGTKDWRVTDPNATATGAQAYKPNPILSFSVNDTVGAIRAELLVDEFGGHIGTTNKRFRFNGRSWITIPELGTANGIPAGRSGQCYYQQLNPVIQVPLNQLRQGNNTLEGTSGGQSCYSFNWGQWGWYGAILRIYYGPGKGNITGSITSPSPGATVFDNPMVTASASSPAGISKIEFFASYEGFDPDGDGIYGGYQHSYHRLKTDVQMLTKFHVGTTVNPPFQVAWNTGLVPDQNAGAVKLIARIQDNTGLWFVTDEVSGLTLRRDTVSVKLYRSTNIPERFNVRTGRTTASCTMVIPAQDSIPRATAATLLARTWNGADAGALTGQTHSLKLNTWTASNTAYGVGNFFDLDLLTLPLSAIKSGTNTVTFSSTSSGHGIDIVWPGPALIVRYSTAPRTPPVITLQPLSRTVDEGAPVSFTVGAMGSTPLQYQWRRNGATIVGATAATFAIASASQADNGASFDCVVTNSLGTATSDAALLTVVVNPPVILQHPASQTVGTGRTATFGITVGGSTPMSYQWSRNSVDVPGATSAWYITPATTSADSGVVFRCRVTNGGGTLLSSPATLLVVQGTPASMIVSDDFNVPSLNTSLWTFINPGTPSTLTMTGAGTQDARVAISVPAGSAHDMWTSGAFGPRILQPANNTDFEIQVKFDGSMTSQYQMQGVMVEQTDRDYLRFDFVRRTSETRVYAASAVNNVFTQRWNTTITGSVPIYMRIRRVGNQWTQWYSSNGTTWTQAGTFSHTLSVGRVGPWVGNAGSPIPAFTGLIDYLFNTVSPINPEDGTALPPTITTDPVSLNVPIGQTGTFTVTALGSAPLAYQWQRNGANIAGASGASYTTPATVRADSGSAFRCVVTNGLGSDTSTAAVLSVIPHPSGIKSDDFNAFALNTNLWFVVNPLLDAFTSMVGTNTQDARFSVELPGGVTHDAWTGGNTSFRLMQTTANTDFELEAKFDSPLPGSGHVQGILIQQDVDNFLRFDFNRDATGNLDIFGASIAGPTGTSRIHITAPLAPPFYLRVRRQGNLWTQSYSPNGTTWTIAGSFTYTLNATSVGPFFANGGSTPTALTGLLDYFFLTAEPIIPEDGGTAVDTFPPVLSNITTLAGAYGFTTSWRTNEPATGLVEYGLTTTYESGMAQHADLRTVRNLTVTGLLPDTLYNFRLTSVDLAGNIGRSQNFTLRTVRPTPPVFTIWYGKNQTFGQIGNPTPYINILGNVLDSNGIASLSYTLNGGVPLNLSIGPDTRRLNRTGDFNADILFSTLLAGANQVIITAVDSQMAAARETVMVNYVEGNSWPATYSVDWSTVTNPNDVVQIPDGRWAISNNNLRVAETGYDRLISIGDQNWVDYEVTASFLVHAIDSSGFQTPSNGAALGFILRWPGHSDLPSSTAGWQPKSGFLPLGAFAVHEWTMQASRRLVILGNNLGMIGENFSKTVNLNARYYFKARVETFSGIGSRYSMKIWQDGTAEPATWDISGPQTSGSPATGSLLIVAHELDVSVGNISVTPLQVASTLVSDDFYGPTLNPSLWSLINPRSDASAAITGAGTSDARLAISVPAGLKHEPWLPANTAPRVMQAVNNTSFEIAARFESAFTAEVQMHGILVEQDSVNFVRFDFSSSGTATKIFSGTVRNTTGTGRYDVNITTGTPQYMKVKRLGDLWTLFYSYDGSSWTQAVQFTHSLNVQRVGPFAGNAGTALPAYTALVDYVFNTLSPLVPEDAGAGVPAGIVQEPASTTVTEGDSAAFTVLLTGTPPIALRWQRNGVDIAGGNSATYRFGPVTVSADNGAQFRCIVSNTWGADTSLSATLTVAYPPSIIISDDFRAGSLNSAIWRTVNPLNDATFAVTGTGTQNARLTIAVPGGVVHDAWTTGNTTPRILQDANNTNFEVETKFESAISSVYQMQGIIVQQNATNFIRFDFVTHATLNFTRVFAASFINGVPTTRLNVNTVAKGVQPLYLRVNRLGDLWTVSYSQNGSTYTTAGSFTHALVVDSVGIFAGNAGSTPPAFTSVVDYFFNTASPLNPEDPVPPGIVTQPTDRWVTEGQRGIFSVVASGTPPLAYQWQKNGVDIPGGTGITYYSLPVLPADSGSGFRCVVTNSIGSVTSQSALLHVTPPIPLVWWNDGWEFRIPITVQANAFERVDKPVESPVDFTNALAQMGASAATFDETSVRIVEVDSLGNILDTLVQEQLDKIAGYHPATNAAGTLIFFMEGITPAVGTRRFDVYFDTLGGGSFVPPVFPAQVAVSDTADYQGQASFKIVTAAGTLYYHKPGAGFASYIDQNGQDWISYRPGFGAGGEFRGIPNAGDVFHPGYTNSTSSLESQGPLKARIRSVSIDNAWEAIWDIFPRYSRMTMLRIATPYWWLYEGTPGGAFNIATDYTVRPTGVRSPASTSWSADFPNGREWAYFGDGSTTRVLYAAHHEDNTINDYYRHMDSLMTVFGFGRKDPCCNRYITVVPQNFTFGFAEDSSFTNASKTIFSAYKDLIIAQAAPQYRGGPGTVPLSTIVSDNFNSPSLNSQLWTYFNPFGDAALSTTGSQLQIVVPGGTTHDIWTTGINSPRVMQSANNANFEVEAKFQSAMVAGTQTQGILVQQDAGSILRFDFVRKPTGLYIFSSAIQAGVASNKIDSLIAGGPTLFLRVKRLGNRWTQSYSLDGSTWNVATVFTHTMVVNSIGVFFGNAGTTPPQFTGLIDYFNNTETPIVPTKANGGDVTAAEESPIPTDYFLNPNYPNPFNPSTSIQYGLPEPATVTLTIYNMLGQKIATLVDARQEAGYRSVAWRGVNNEGSAVGSGVYIYRITATGASGRNYAQLKKMILMR